ncbi:unnamed protein product, partial [Linum tenue]
RQQLHDRSRHACPGLRLSGPRRRDWSSRRVTPAIDHRHLLPRDDLVMLDFRLDIPLTSPRRKFLVGVVVPIRAYNEDPASSLPCRFSLSIVVGIKLSQHRLLLRFIITHAESELLP